MEEAKVPVEGLEVLEENFLLEMIAKTPKLVLKVWMDNCPNCDEFAPVFEKVAADTLGFAFASFHLPANTAGKSEFKKKYMTPDEKGKIGAPAIMIFENGELAFKNYGKISEMQFRELLMPLEAKLFSLYARKGEILSAYEELPGVNQKIAQLLAIKNQRA